MPGLYFERSYPFWEAGADFKKSEGNFISKRTSESPCFFSGKLIYPNLIKFYRLVKSVWLIITRINTEELYLP
jgi:hypothetical protein